MNNKFYFVIAAVLATPAFSQSVSRTQDATCRSGDTCSLTQLSTDGGKTFKSSEGYIQFGEKALATMSATPSRIEFAMNEKGEVEHIATQTALEQFFSSQKSSKYLSTLKEKEAVVIKAAQSGLDPELLKHFKLISSVDFFTGETRFRFELENLDSGWTLKGDDVNEDQANHVISDLKEEYLKQKAAQNRLPESVEKMVGTRTLGKAIKEHQSF
jgi:hypothetical protein